jgi:hypothetical protein
MAKAQISERNELNGWVIKLVYWDIRLTTGRRGFAEKEEARLIANL